MVNHKWEHITDLDPHQHVARRDIRALAHVWIEHRCRLGHLPAYRMFETRLKREWAIETGLIENIYAFGRGATKLLIEHGISSALIPRQDAANPDHVAAMIKDQELAVNGLFEFAKSHRCLSTSYIKEIHALMTRHQENVECLDSLGRMVTMPLNSGQYKTRPNNPHRPENGGVHEYCPPEHVASEMDQLIRWHHEHQERGVAPEVEAAWLHHRFIQIHPFQDGNGRVARALATLVFIKANWFPLVVRSDQKADYIEALEMAASGDLVPLVDYFSRWQKKAFTRALQIAEEAKQEQKVADTIASVRRQLQRRKDSLPQKWEAVKSIAGVLRLHAEKRLQDVADELKFAMRDILEDSTFFADGASDDSGQSHFYRFQIFETAKALDYYANLQAYKAWTRLVLRSGDQTDVLISFHGIGYDFQGVLACSASFFQRSESEEGEHEIGPVKSLMDEVFLISYNETADEAKSRFSKWLEEAIARGIRLWNKSVL